MHELSAVDLRFDDIDIGRTAEIVRAFTEADVQRFAAISGDASPLHVDPQYAATTEFGRCVVHGLLLASLFSQIVGMRLPGRAALYLGQELTFRRPVLVGETVRATGRVTAKSAATRTITIAMEIRNSEDKVAVTGSARVKVRDSALAQKPPAEPAPGEPVRSSPSSGVAIVTGASRGIGAQIAIKLAALGHAVAINYLNRADRAGEVAETIRRSGGRALPLRADVRDDRQIRDMIESAAHQLGPPQYLINCAAGELELRPIDSLDWPDFSAQLDYAVKSVLATCKSVHPYMKAAGGGAIVNILSQVTSGVPPSRMADYVTAKYALSGLSRALAVEWAGDRIRVNMVSPSLVETELTAFHGERVFKLEAQRTPLKRVATPSDVASAVAFLIGEESAFLTGVNLFVTGGQVMI